MPESPATRSQEAEAANLIKELLREGRQPAKECEQLQFTLV